MIPAIIYCIIATAIIFIGLLAYACVRTQRKPCTPENKPKNWSVIELEHHETGAQEIHVTPNNDNITHEMPGDTCPCGARWEHENGVTLYTHHSLDGRERNE